MKNNKVKFVNGFGQALNKKQMKELFKDSIKINDFKPSPLYISEYCLFLGDGKGNYILHTLIKERIIA